MTPRLYTKLARGLFPVRWWLFAASIGSMLLIAAVVTLGGERGLATVWLAGPMVGLPWAALCAAKWFHPEHGNMQPASRFFGRLPLPVQTVIRWYAAIFLAFFVVVCGAAWPIFAMSTT